MLLSLYKQIPLLQKQLLQSKREVTQKILQEAGEESQDLILFRDQLLRIEKSQLLQREKRSHQFEMQGPHQVDQR